MGALEDYINQIEASAQNAKNKMWSNIEGSYAGFENYLAGKKADFYGGQPTEEQLRLKRQQIKDQYIQSTQEMRDREMPAMPEPVARQSRIQLPERDPLAYPTQGATVSDQQLQALSDKQRLEEQAKYLMHQQMVDEAARQMVNASENRPEIRQVMKAPAAIQIQPGPLQEPPTPNIPVGWQLDEAPQEQLSQETLAFLTPEERFAVAQGYVPAKAQATTNTVDFSQPAFSNPPATPVVAPVRAVARGAMPLPTGTQEQSPGASGLFPDGIAQNTQSKRVEAPPVVTSAYEEMLKYAPENLQPMLRNVKAANTQRMAARREAAAQALQEIEAYRQAEIHAINEGAQQAIDAKQDIYGEVQYNIARDRALAYKNAEMAKAELYAQGMESTAATEFLKQAREKINDNYKEASQPFESTDQYKRAMNALDSMSKEIRDQHFLSEQISQLKSKLAVGDIDGATQYAKTTVAQTQQNLRSQNAIQNGEMIIKYSPLLDPVTMKALTGKWVGSQVIDRFFQNLYSGKPISDSDKQQIGNAVKNESEAFGDILAKSFRAEPQKFLQTTIDTSNANAASLNKSLTDLVIIPTSNKTAKVKLFEMEPDYIPSVSPQSTVPVSGGVRQYKTKSGVPVTWKQLP